jgi:hypothetical protein
MPKQFEAESEGVTLQAYDFESQNDITLRLYLVAPAGVPFDELETIELRPLDAAGWDDFLAAMRAKFDGQFEQEAPREPDAEKYARLIQPLVSRKNALAFVAPRGVGPTAWNPDRETHIRRRFMLLGQTLDGMRVWDTRRAIQATRAIEGLANTSLRLRAKGDMAGIALYAALFEPRVERLVLHGLPRSHRVGPDFLNVLRVLDVPQAVALVAENSPMVIHQNGSRGWEFATAIAVAEKLGWKDNIKIEPAADSD